MPTVQRSLKTEQSFSLPPPQTPPLQVVSVVQSAVLGQFCPSWPGVTTQLLVASVQTPTLQASAPAQSFGVPPSQAPSWQTSFSVQKRPSSHGQLLCCGNFSHFPLRQLPTLHVSVNAVQSAIRVQGRGTPPPVLAFVLAFALTVAVATDIASVPPFPPPALAPVGAVPPPAQPSAASAHARLAALKVVLRRMVPNIR